MALVFDLAVRRDVNDFVVNNVSRALANRFTLKFAVEVLQDTNRYDLYHTFADLFLTASKRASEQDLLRNPVRESEQAQVRSRRCQD